MNSKLKKKVSQLEIALLTNFEIIPARFPSKSFWLEVPKHNVTENKWALYSALYNICKQRKYKLGFAAILAQDNIAPDFAIIDNKITFALRCGTAVPTIFNNRKQLLDFLNRAKLKISRNYENETSS